MSFVRVGNPAYLQPPPRLARMSAQSFGAVAESFAPDDLPSLETWWDLSDASTLFTDAARTTPVTADADPIGGVTDKSGNDNHLADTGADYDPPAHKVNIQNDLSVARCDGVNDGLAAALTQAQPGTVFFIAKKNAATDDEHMFDGATHPDRWLIGRSGGNWVTYAGALLSAGAADTDPHIFAAIFNGASSKLYIGGGAAVASGDAGAATLVNPHFGKVTGGAWASMDVMEVCIFSSALVVADLNRFGGYANTKWDLPWATAT